MREIIDQLQRLRHRAWLHLVTQRTAVIVACAVGVVLLLIGLDYLLRWPSAIRAVIWAVGLAGLGWGVWRYLLAAVGFNPSLTQMALRVESSLPSVAGRLASSVEFATSGLDATNALASRSVRETETRLAGESVDRSLNLTPTWRGLGGLAAVLAIAVTLVFVNPSGAVTGVTRTLVPWSSAKWPARTGVQSLMHEVLPNGSVHPQGQALALRAAVTKGDDDQRVHVRYRMVRDGRTDPWQDLVLTHQGEGVHERLIDTTADEVQLSFRTADDATGLEKVRLAPPPAVERATLTVTPPPYAASRIAGVEQELGTGVDQRSVTDQPVLAGSTAVLDFTLNKPLPVPTEVEQAAWLQRTFAWSDPLPTFTTDPDQPRRWSLTWPVADTVVIAVTLEDEHGLKNRAAINYRIESVEDRLPVVTMTEPQSDESVLATAVVPLVTEATDDVAVATLTIQANVQRKAPGEPPVGAGAEPAWLRTRDADAAAVSLAESLSLSELEVSEGDVVLVQGIAQDNYELDGQRHDPRSSPVRRLVVISELDFSSQLRRQLGAVRQNAIRVEAVQSELQDDVIENGPMPGAERGQAQIGERIAAQREVLEEVRRQIEMNQLEDEQLNALLDQAGDLLDFAGRASSQAVEALAEAAPGKPGDGRQRGDGQRGDLHEPQPQDEPIVEAQQAVREELSDLIQLLDRDEDTWVVTRQLESLLEEQSRLQAETAQLSQQTVGRERSELTEAEQAELDRIAEAQGELPERARQLIDELRDRAQAMQEVDPETSSGMRSAADTAEQRELDRDMENAANRAEQNQLQNAMANQEQARETLQRMLESIEQSQRVQAAQLVRQLESLIKSIERLIVVQENELTALSVARADERYVDRDRSMIRLSQNTQAVASEARAAGQPARRIARTLDRAADAQGAAVVALRARPVEPDTAQTAEDTALELLKEAKALAEALKQETQEEQTREQRAELIDAYRELLERQVLLNQQTGELSGHDQLDRRQLMDARRIASREDDLSRDLNDLLVSVSDLSDAMVFNMVHDKIDRWCRQVSEQLREGDVGVDVTDRQRWVAGAIGRLIDALEELNSPPEEEFAGNQGQGEGQGGEGPPQGLIPPVAELKLIQGVQEEIYNQTRELDGRSDLDDAQRRQRLRDLGQEQRELQRVGAVILQQLAPQLAPPPEEADAETGDEAGDETGRDGEFDAEGEAETEEPRYDLP